MELNYKNYYKQEKNLLNLIKISDFISFNLELTGRENDKNNSLIDTPENRYLKYKKTTEKFSIIQLGLSFFKLVTNPNIYHKQICYDCFPYNLYLFPNAKDLKEISQDELNLEVKCMHFNKRGNIDFNKWINEGIHYLNQKQYRELYKNITENNINNDNFYMDVSNLKQRDIDLAEKNIENIKNNFINNGKIYNTNYVINCFPKYILYYIKKNLPNTLYFQENNKFNKKNFCTLITGYKTKEEKEKLYIQDTLFQLKELNHKKGVKTIIDAIFNKFSLDDNDIEDYVNKKNNNIKNEKKVLIGHNMSLDLMFIISKLGDTLPYDYSSFKKMIKNKLYCIYDTKYIFEEFKNNNKNNIEISNIKSTLDNMYPYLSSTFAEYIKIKVKPNEELFKSASYHSAGYDSYIAGACFLYMKIAMRNTDFLEKNKNQIFLMNSLYKSININKSEDDYLININNSDENIFVFRGIRKISELNVENIFGKKLWEDSVCKILFCEKNNILIVFTNFSKNSSNEKQNLFASICFNKLNKNNFSCFTLKEFRSKYMK